MDRKKNAVRKGLISLLMVAFLGTFSACLSFSTGEPVKSEVLSSLEKELSALSTQSILQDEMISHLATQVGVVHYSTPNARPTFTPYQPIMGGIRIENGACCVGGIAGETTEISVHVEARNIEGKPVPDMRILHGAVQFTEAQMESANWEAYTSSSVFTIPVVTNWSTYYVCVQFRDADGNLSTVMCDDIAVEGHPTSATSSPQG